MDRYYIVVAALHALAKDGEVPASEVAAAIKNMALIRKTESSNGVIHSRRHPADKPRDDDSRYHMLKYGGYDFGDKKATTPDLGVQLDLTVIELLVKQRSNSS